jgi:RimJ/RimL family protein N-acetyltransferase
MLRFENFTKNHLDQIDLGYEMPKETKSGFIGNEAYKGVTLFNNDDILAVGGVHTLWEGVGECWIMLSKSGRKKPFTVAKYTFVLFDNMISQENIIRLQASIASTDDKALKFAKWLGFEFEGIMRKYGPDGDDYYRVARITNG